MIKVFIDGREGTTGLRIYERLAERQDISLIVLSEELRKDPAARKEALNAADIAFLCLPDAAAMEAVSMIENDTTRVIDASTAHRTLPEWCYGLPELSPAHLEKLKASKRTAVPGCHASGFISLVYPLVAAGVLPADALLTCHSITGYSGGGKKMIAQYEDEGRDQLLSAPRQYGITQQHKHLKEMKAICGLKNSPIFCPIVSDFYSGMCVTVPLFKSQLAAGKTIEDVKAVYQSLYQGPMIRYQESMDEAGFLSGNAMSGLDSMQVTVCGNDERILLISRFDNLGKGASGAALQCMNIMLGDDPTHGLNL
ncbi:MAG: N-acetyl-gamma-glutamyl-phosphate reductase [Ruminococcaceae bacterium]|nr:N-acetyl-gamma-glutamyl-phosphate reductase [Oscillospiraceae bacterium]